MIEKKIALLTIKEAFLTATAAKQRKLQELLKKYNEMDEEMITDDQYNEIINMIKARQ